MLEANEAHDGGRYARLPDGTPVVMRPLHSGDQRAITEGFEHLSAETRRLRFFSGGCHLPEGHADRLVHADGVNHLAWGIAVLDGGKERGIGIARVIRSPEQRDTGEFAITIADEWQHRGAGTLLARTLVEQSRAVGIRHWLGFVSLENFRVQRLLEHVAHEESRKTFGDGTAEILYRL